MSCLELGDNFVVELGRHCVSVLHLVEGANVVAKMAALSRMHLLCVHQMVRQCWLVQDTRKILRVVNLVEGKTNRPQQAPHGWQPFLQLFHVQLRNIHLGNEIVHSFFLGVELLPPTEDPVTRFFFYFLHCPHDVFVGGRFFNSVADCDVFVPTLLTPDFSNKERNL